MDKVTAAAKALDDFLDSLPRMTCPNIGPRMTEADKVKARALQKAYLDAKEQAEADWQRGYRLIGDPFDSLGDELP